MGADVRQPSAHIRIRIADNTLRRAIYAARHAVYGLELGQHEPNELGLLTDSLDDFNCYVAAEQNGRLAGFISITPPGRSYSIDKYFHRGDLPFEIDDRLFEIRILTVLAPHRGRFLAALLMYAAFRFVEEHGGSGIVALGRLQLLDFYQRFGLHLAGMKVQSGAVTYELLTAPLNDVRQRLQGLTPHLRRFQKQCDWELPFSFSPTISCEHGGSFWMGVGENFRTLEKLDNVVAADVLDAWFPPAPAVITALRLNLSRLVSTSPPTGASGLISCISEVRGIPESAILPAAGSSELIYLAFPRWLSASSRVLVLDPSYGEYSHLLEKVIGCKVLRVPLERENQYRIDVGKLHRALQAGCDLLVLVNPNSPTGGMLSGTEMRSLLQAAPASTRVWIDETYIEFAGTGHSVEPFAASSKNVFVCKSMSKGYALSGLRVAYLVGPPSELSSLKKFSPPWAISLPAQVGAIAALESREYYQARYAETKILREELSAELVQRFEFEVTPGVANFVLCHAPQTAPTSQEICRRTKDRGVYLRDAGRISPTLGNRALRVAVKNRREQQRLLEALAEVLAQPEVRTLAARET